MSHRFQDQNLRISDFYDTVAVVCTQCNKKALATVNHNTKVAKIYCSFCGYNKTKDTNLNIFGQRGYWSVPAHYYFNVQLWYQYPFKNDLFYAFNYNHLVYLEDYIAALLREHKNRTHFTLLEKLPKFYHEAKNREALLKIIIKLKQK